MSSIAKRCAVIVCALGLVSVSVSFSSASTRRSRSDKDINAIGQRDLRGAKLGNWYSVDSETEMGKQQSVEIERCYKVLDDPALTDYISQLGAKIAQNSDAKFPIRVRLIDRDESTSFTLPGGYQYITTGLLLKLQSEGELASILARGIAHTALRTTTRLMTRAQWARVGSIPLIYVGTMPRSNSSSITVPMTWLSLARGLEYEADYFGVQYLYKAGYDPRGYLDLLVQVWPPSTPQRGAAAALSPYPPTAERLKRLNKEIAEILPRRDGAIISTLEFGKFKIRLSEWKQAPPKN